MQRVTRLRMSLLAVSKALRPMRFWLCLCVIVTGFAAPAVAQSTVTVTKAGTGSGRVTSTPTRIDCGTVCSSAFDAGSTVVLTATRDAGSLFTGWSGACSGTGSCILNMTDARTVTATFVHVAPFGGLIYEVLYSFNGSDGAQPIRNLIQGSDGNFYGTTYGASGFGSGTVFRLTPSGTLTTLYAFTGGTDGAAPYAGLTEGSDGNFYGTTYGGGAFFVGTVFRLTPDGTLTTLHSFQGSDGSSPYGGLTQGNDGNFYGTTRGGGGSDLGTVFMLTPAGVLTTLHEFTGSDGSRPYAGLIQGGGGNFYGTTYGGGASNLGTVFRMTPGGALTTLYSFDMVHGSLPYDRLAEGSDGNFYGTTCWGGASNLGTVFSMTPGGTLATLYSFGGSQDASPYAGVIQGSDGSFYGTTSGNGYSNSGTVFKLTPSGSLTTLRALAVNGSQGAAPRGSLIQGSDGHFYGTTSQGGAYSHGAIFVLRLANPLTVQKTGTGNGTVTSNVGGINCGNSCSAMLAIERTITLTATPAGGSTFSGWSGACTNGSGTCTLTMAAARTVTATFTPIVQTFTFTVSKAGSGSGTVTSDIGGINCGSTCSAAITAGTTISLTAVPDAGSSLVGWSEPSCGGNATCVVTVTSARNVTVTFAHIEARAVTVTKAGTGSGRVTSTPTRIDCGTVCSSAFDAGSTVVLTATRDAGSLFTGWSGACSGTGPCIMSMSQARAVTATFAQVPPFSALAYEVLHEFSGTNTNPNSSLIQESVAGNLYGTTLNVSSGGSGSGLGSVFRLTPGGVFTTLHEFSNIEGTFPWSALVQGSDGNFYGTTQWGGASNLGTVFKMSVDGTVTTLHSFSGPDGTNLYSALIQGTDGTLYGTTATGGTMNGGTVFRLTPGESPTLTTLHSFNITDGDGPLALIQGTDGNFYGTTRTGGTSFQGTVYQLTPGESPVLTTLHSFGGTDGTYPQAGLLLGSDGNFYGTTGGGGAHGWGTIFKLAPGPGNWPLTTLYSFSGGSDGRTPHGALIEGADGNLYGTTVGAMPPLAGTVFRLTPGESPTLTTLHTFTGSDGAHPEASVFQGSDGNFYGTTSDGGAHDKGVVFVLRLTNPLNVNVTKVGAGAGTVTSTPAGIDCGPSCGGASQVFGVATSVTLTATPDSGSTFAGWSGACTNSSGICTLTPNGAQSVTAHFDVIVVPRHGLSVTRGGTGAGTVTSDIDGIDCGATCSASFNSGTHVTLTAVAAAGSFFAGWSGACDGAYPTCTVTMDQARTVAAAFSIVATVSLSVVKVGTGGGTVTSNIGGINCGSTCSAAITAGTTISLTGVPDAGSSLVGWSEPSCGGNATCAITVRSATSVTVTFGATPATLTVAKAGTGSGSVTSVPAGINCGQTCAGSFEVGTSVTLTATPDQGSLFAGWSGACSGIGACVLSMTQARTVTATFTQLAAGRIPAADPGGPYVTYVGGDLLLGARALSTDPAIVSYEWDINGDGQYEVTGATSSLPWMSLQAMLQSPLDYPADPRTGLPTIPLSLHVTDAAGRANVSTTTLTVYSRRPFAVPDWGPQPAVPIGADGKATVRLDGSGSYHGYPAYDIVDWSWKVKGAVQSINGVTANMEVDLGPLPTPLPAGGIIKTLVLTVTDTLNQTDTMEFDVTFNRLPSNPPAIKFNVSTAGIFIERGEGFWVSAAATSDPDGDWIRSLAWDVNNDGAHDIVWTRSDTNGDGRVDNSDAGPNYVLQMTWAQMADYAGLQASGHHFIPLTVVDSSGTSARATVRLTILDKALIAKAEVVPGAGDPDTAFTFRGSQSRHLFPNQSITSWQWDFENDGFFDVQGQSAQHTYNAPGVFTVRLQVTDSAGHSNTDTIQVSTLNANLPPVARPGGPYLFNLESVNASCQLDGSASFDPSSFDSIVAHEWNVAGGRFTLSGPTPSLTFAQIQSLGAGVHSIALTVTDSFGMTQTAATTLTIYNNVPIAAFTANPGSPELSQSVTFDASGSHHDNPPRTISVYQWLFRYNGSSAQFDSPGPDAIGKIVVHTFGTPGTYTVALRVVDDNNPAKSAIATRTFTFASICQPPVAKAGGPYATSLGVGMTLDGSGSTADCSITSYAWDVDGDGAFTDATGQKPALSPSQIGALGPGTHTITLEVTDSAGNSSTATATLTVVAGTIRDFNGDGKPDIFWQNLVTGEIIAWLMNGTTMSREVRLAAPIDRNWQLAACADFNQDGNPDLLWRNAATGEIQIWHMDGTTHVGSTSLDTVPDLHWQVAAAADFNGDGKPDIVWRNIATGENVVRYMDGSTRMADESVRSWADGNWTIVGADDFNGDGKPDLLWRNRLTGENMVWFLNRTAYVASAELETVPDTHWTVVATGDFNGDGNADIVWCNRATGETSIWFMTGTMHAGTAPLPVVPVTASGRPRGDAPTIGFAFPRTGASLSQPLAGRLSAGSERAPRETAPSLAPSPDSIARRIGGDGNAAEPADRAGAWGSGVLWRSPRVREHVWFEIRASDAGHAAPPEPDDPTWERVTVADFDGNGEADGIWRDRITGEIVIWFARDGEHLDYAVLPLVPDENWQIVTVADYDDDGTLDLLWRNQATGESVVWLMKASGS